MRDLAVIWGLDGTLLDNEALQFEKLQACCAAHGVPLGREEYDTEQGFHVPDGVGGSMPASMPLRGAGDLNAYFWLVERKPKLAKKLPLAKWLAQLHAHVLAQRHRMAVRSAVPGLLKALQAEGVPQAIVTNASRAHTELGLRALGDAYRVFSEVVTADHLPRTKPEPDGVRAAATRLQAAVMERRGAEAKPLVLVIDDSPVGVRAAHRAGLPCVQFLNPGQVPAKIEAGNPGFRATRRTAELAEILVSMAGV